MKWMRKNPFDFSVKIRWKNVYTSMESIFPVVFTNTHTRTHTLTPHLHRTVNTWAHSLCIFQKKKNIYSCASEICIFSRLKINWNGKWHTHNIYIIIENEFHTKFGYLFDWFCNWFWWRFLYDITRCCRTNCIRRKHYSIRDDTSNTSN